MPTKFTQKQIIIVGGVVLVLIVGFLVFSLNIRKPNSSAQAITLTVWGTDNTRAFNDLLASYAGPGSGTGAQIRYTQIDPADYQSKLLAALAAGTGPDVFEIGNRDLSQWKSVIAPVPVTLAQQFNEVTLESDFPTVVDQDFVSAGQIYALPLSIDTIAMIYNKDLFDTAGIATIPKTWEDVQADIPLLRTVNAQGQITQSAAAIGGSETTIADAPDLVFLLMLQNGAQLTSPEGSSVTFATSGGADGAGLTAFNYYLHFANSASGDYTWNDSMGDAVSSFAQGKTAILFDYSSVLPQITAQSPFLNYGVAPMPQPANATVAVNYAKYNGLAVAKASPQLLQAWNFIINLTTSPTDENIYLKDTDGPPALRSVIQADETNPVISVFADQALTARSWSEPNSTQVDSIMNTAIQNVLNGASDSGTALSQAQTAMNSIGN
jgi:multiple sugar transport system substrate-binding protein